MSEGKVLSDVDPRGCATVTLNRPERGNALDPEMLAGLSDTLAALRDRAEVRVVVLRGAGRHFCSGMDVSAIKPAGLATHGPGIGPICLLLDELPKPVIAVVQGATIGAGCALLACCDVVIAVTEASFAISEVRLGLAPSGLTPFFLRTLGHRQLRRYMLSGERMSAEKAAELGLVREVCSVDTIEAKLPEVVDGFLRAAPAAFAVAKAAISNLNVGPIDERLLAGLESEFARNAVGPEAQEGKASFREKRPPSWYKPNS
jgi:methylglutaconyl-CoA hydratase